MDRVRLSTLDALCLFACLRSHGDRTGLDIGREITAGTGIEDAPGTIYATLERLTARGFVTAEAQPARTVRGGRARKGYSPTAEGREALKGFLADIKRMAEGVDL